jgi:hypothetical protein
MPTTSRPLGTKFRANIDYALRKHAKFPLRSEKHGHYRDLYVDVDQLQALDSLDWQVIYGRRGTGKTFLLGMLDELSRAEPSRRQISILMPAPDCKVSPVGRAVSDKQRALGYFQTFLELLVDKVTAQFDQLLAEPSFLDRITGQRRRVIDKAFEMMVELLELANQGRPVAAFSDIDLMEEEISSAEDAATASAGIEAAIEPRPKLRMSTGAERHLKKSNKASNRKETRSVAVPRFALVSRMLQDLLKLLKIERLTILIDEWSTLDPTGATGIQPEFAELLKRTFHGAPMVTVKIATNRYQTRFSNRGAGGSYRGLELEADMFEALNLDRVVLDREGLVSFYETLLFNRLALFDETLKAFKPRGVDIPDEVFVLSIFRDQRAFEELVKGAEGIPRDFIALFKAIAKNNDHTVATRWTATAIQDVIRLRSVSGLEDIEYRSVTSQLMDPCIRGAVARTGSGSSLFHAISMHRSLIPWMSC